MQPSSMSKTAMHAEEVAFRLVPYVKPRLKAIDVSIDAAEPIKVVIGGDG